MDRAVAIRVAEDISRTAGQMTWRWRPDSEALVADLESDLAVVIGWDDRGGPGSGGVVIAAERGDDRSAFVGRVGSEEYPPLLEALEAARGAFSARRRAGAAAVEATLAAILERRRAGQSANQDVAIVQAELGAGNGAASPEPGALAIIGDALSQVSRVRG